MTKPSIFTDRETIRLSQDGTFFSDGVEITHEGTVAAFHRSLGRDEQGYFIQIGTDFKRIEVEDTAYFIKEIEWSQYADNETVMITLNDETREVLEAKTLSYRPDRLTCRVKGGNEEAKFLRKAYLELLMHALAERDGYAIQIGGETIRLGKF